jgi:transketolase
MGAQQETAEAQDREMANLNPSRTAMPSAIRPTTEEIALLRAKARHVRLETLRLIEIAKVGHYSSVFSAAEILATLYYDVMALRPGDPSWRLRDRFLMGKGHAAVGLFPILADLGYIARKTLDGYTRLGSALGDHPDMRKVPGIDFSSGSIGHALSAGAGIALGARMSEHAFDVFVLLGDGEMQEGQVWEAAQFASHHRLGRLIAIVDRNGYQLDGKVDDVIGIEPLGDRWRAFGWAVHEVDGHDLVALVSLLRKLKRDRSSGVPACIIAHTLKGKGVSFMESEPGWHLGYLAPEDALRAAEEINGTEI